MGKEECEECREWRKSLYWTCFEPTKVRLFVKVLLPGFHVKLALLRKYLSKFRENLSGTIVLKGPSENAWNVLLQETENDEILLTEGWPEFARDHSLQENDTLVFRYDSGDGSSIHVLVFDPTGCEKEELEFVQKSENCAPDPIEITDSSSDSSSDEKVLKNDNGQQQSSDSGRRPRTRSEYEKKDCVGKGESSRRNNSDHPCKKIRRENSMKGGKIKSKTKSVIRMEAYDPDNSYIDTKLSYSVYYESQRRPVTQAEIRNASKAAQEVKSTRPNFIKVMKPTHVYKRFFLTIPKRMTSYMPLNAKEAILHVPPSKSTWKVRISKGGLDAKWADFVMDNNLEEGDACLFELDEAGQEKIKFDISIFRVVDEIVPLTMVKISQSQSLRG